MAAWLGSKQSSGSGHGQFRTKSGYKVPDSRFKVSRSTLLRCNAEGAVEGDTGSAAHDDAVQHRHRRLGEHRQLMVQSVLRAEEPAQPKSVARQGGFTSRTCPTSCPDGP